MSLELQNVFKDVPEEELGSLRGCLVEGDPGQRSRERHVRRRARVLRGGPAFSRRAAESQRQDAAHAAEHLAPASN